MHVNNVHIIKRSVLQQERIATDITDDDRIIAG